jgi:3-deoxy-D-manno-octulosonic-acid transferase
LNVRTLYMLASYLLIPYLAIRALRRPDYLKRWRERFGYYRKDIPDGGIVLHAASVGEVNAAAPLIRVLTQRFAPTPLTVTCFTPAGSDRTLALFEDEVHHVYAPLDFPGAVRRFYRMIRPRLIIIMETEIWPNFYFAAAQEGVPILMANARISDKSIKGYRRMPGLPKAALAQVARIAAQSEADAERFRGIGAPADRVTVTGNLKFDLSLSDALHQHGLRLRRNWGEQRPVLLAASTHQGEEGPVLAAFLGLLRSFPEALLVLAPRQPQRFEPAARAARSAGLVVQMHSQGPACGAATNCLVVDALGALLPYYAACDVAFVGGSLEPIGGHNVLEPAALSIPVLVGPHTFNFADIAHQMLASGGAQRVNNAAGLEHAAARLFGDDILRQKMGEAGQALVQGGQGALARTLLLIEEIWDQSNS